MGSGYRRVMYKDAISNGKKITNELIPKKYYNLMEMVFQGMWSTNFHVISNRRIFLARGKMTVLK